MNELHRIYYYFLNYIKVDILNGTKKYHILSSSFNTIKVMDVDLKNLNKLGDNLIHFLGL